VLAVKPRRRADCRRYCVCVCVCVASVLLVAHSCFAGVLWTVHVRSVIRCVFFSVCFRNEALTLDEQQDLRRDYSVAASSSPTVNARKLFLTKLTLPTVRLSPPPWHLQYTVVSYFERSTCSLLLCCLVQSQRRRKLALLPSREP